MEYTNTDDSPLEHFDYFKNELYFFKRFLFIFREGGREGEKKGEKHQCVVAHLLLGT